MEKTDKWDKRFMELTETVARWSSCFQETRHVGAIIVRDKRVMTTGYNGAPAGIKSCEEKGECLRRKKLSQTGIRGSNGNIKYLTFDEASYLAKVSRSMINKWADKGKFTVIKVGSRVRIRRDEFEDWMEQRDLERSMQ